MDSRNLQEITLRPLWRRRLRHDGLSIIWS